MRDKMQRSAARLLVVGVVALAGISAGRAEAGHVPDGRQASGSCTVGASHGTIQAAVLDPACSSVELPAGTYAESVVVTRSLSLLGPSGATATISGGLVADGAGILVELTDLTLDSTSSGVAGCVPRALVSTGGARVTTNGVRVAAAATGSCIFVDSFESSTTARWSAAIP